MSKKLLFLILFLLLTYHNIRPISDSLKDNNIKNDLVSSIPQEDTLFHSGRISINSDNVNNFVNHFLPSLVAIIISLIAIGGNYLISNRQLRFSKEQFETQLKSAKETLQQQIDASKHSTELEFRSKVRSFNRQNWINDLRNVISELSASIVIFVSRDFTPEKVQQIIYLITKAELMLNANDSRDQGLIYKLKEYKLLILSKDIDASKVSSKMREIISDTQVILKSEWERVKKGD